MSFEVDDDAYPATTVAYIEATWANGAVGRGSGVLVGRNDVLTAAHVIYNLDLGLAQRIEVYPSYDPDASNNEAFSFAYIQYYPDFDPDGDGRIFPGDFSSGTIAQTERDIALITLSEAAGDVYGWMGRDPSFSFGEVGVLGHPEVYGFQPFADLGFAQYSTIDNAVFFESLEVNPGNSGGPLYYDYGNGPYVVGLISTGIAAVGSGLIANR